MKNRITELLGIKYPIIQSGMSHGAYPPLVAAVSNAGGLGILGAGDMDEDELWVNIRNVRELTDKPFGVNFVVTNPVLDKLLDVCIKEQISIVTCGRGDPTFVIKKLKPYGIISMPTAGAVKHSVKIENAGGDALTIQGLEGGGHTGFVSTLVLLPQVVDTVKIPVVSSGGYCDGRGLAVALLLGAQGISMGTRFALTKESTLPDDIKKYYLNYEGDTFITEKVTGTRCRSLYNKLVDMVEKDGQGEQLGLGNNSAGLKAIERALVFGDKEMGFMPCGQVRSRITDIPTCRDLIERIMEDVE